MYEAGRCRTFNILVGFPHKITDSNHSRHFEADIFFHGFFMDFYKSKIQIIYTTLICPKTKKRYSSPNKGQQITQIYYYYSSSKIFFLDAAKGEKVTHFTWIYSAPTAILMAQFSDEPTIWRKTQMNSSQSQASFFTLASDAWFHVKIQRTLSVIYYQNQNKLWCDKSEKTAEKICLNTY